MMVELFRVEHDFHVSACAAGQLWDKVHTSSETARLESYEWSCSRIQDGFWTTVLACQASRKDFETTMLMST